MIVTTSARRTSPRYPTITDDGVYPPPSTGSYAYNSDIRPALGGEYRDPVFGKVIRRISNDGLGDNNYAFHYLNCDGTLSFKGGGAFKIINTSDGSDAYTGVPAGLQAYECRWSMTDPDKYYYLSGSSLMRRNLAAGTNTTIKTFASTLQEMGGSVNYSDKTGRYFIVKYSDTAKLWDSQTDTIYTNSIPQLDPSGWTGISPSGNTVVVAGGTTAEPNREHYAYAVNHGTQTVSTTPVQFWGLSGDHCVIVSASDGKDYGIVGEGYDIAAVWRCDLTVDVTGFTPAQQRAAGTMLIDTDWNEDLHFSAVSNGAYSDWIFMATESINNSDDLFDSSPASWRAYKQEIIAINVVTGAKRRLAHHRSRSINTNYYFYPRPSCSANGNAIVWASNFNIQSPAGYVDLYLMQNPLSS